MPKADRIRSRLYPRDLAVVFRQAREINREGVGINPNAHDMQHVPHVLLYTSKATLDTVAGTQLNPMRGGRIVGVRLNVAGAPTSTLTCDILLDGSSVFSGSAKPTIASGSTFGYRAVLDKAFFYPDSKLQIQLTATGSATGPMVVAIEYLPEF